MKEKEYGAKQTQETEINKPSIIVTILICTCPDST